MPANESPETAEKFASIVMLISLHTFELGPLFRKHERLGGMQGYISPGNFEKSSC